MSAKWKNKPKFYKCGRCGKLHPVELNSDFCNYSLTLKQINTMHGDNWDLVHRIQNYGTDKYHFWLSKEEKK